MKKFVITQGLAALTLIVLTATGCGGKLPGLVPAEGELIYNGQPLAWATVTLINADDPNGRPAIGMTDAQGHFQLLTLGERGAFRDATPLRFPIYRRVAIPFERNYRSTARPFRPMSAGLSSRRAERTM